MLRSFIKRNRFSLDLDSIRALFVRKTESNSLWKPETEGVGDLAQVCTLSQHERMTIRKLALSTLRLTGMHSMGAAASRYYGAGLEFDSVREYDVGDDVRRLDWNVTARTGRLHTKVFTEDRSLNICAVLLGGDTMLFSTSRFLKIEVGARFCRVLFELAKAQNDFFSAAVVGPRGLTLQKPSQSGSVWSSFLKSIHSAYEGRESFQRNEVRSAIHEIAARVVTGSLMFVIGDFLNAEDLIKLRNLKYRFDIVVVRVLDPTEVKFSPDIHIGLLNFSSETDRDALNIDPGKSGSVMTCLESENLKLVDFCRREGLALMELSTTTEDYLTPLTRVMRERKARVQ